MRTLPLQPLLYAEFPMLLPRHRRVRREGQGLELVSAAPAEAVFLPHWWDGSTGHLGLKNMDKNIVFFLGCFRLGQNDVWRKNMEPTEEICWKFGKVSEIRRLCNFGMWPLVTTRHSARWPVSNILSQVASLPKTTRCVSSCRSKAGWGYLKITEKITDLYKDAWIDIVGVRENWDIHPNLAVSIGIANDCDD